MVLHGKKDGTKQRTESFEIITLIFDRDHLTTDKKKTDCIAVNRISRISRIPFFQLLSPDL